MVVKTYAAGDYFGELALMMNQPRAATVRAIGNDGARCLKLQRATFDKFAKGCKAILDERAKLYKEEKARQRAAREEERQRVKAEREAERARKAEERELEKQKRIREREEQQQQREQEREKARIARQSSARGVLTKLDKTFRSLAAGVIREGAEGDSTKVGNLAAGEVFDVLEVRDMADGPRRVRMERGWVSVTAKSGKSLLVDESSVQKFLATVPLLQQLSDEDRAGIADVLEVEEFANDMPIMEQGEDGDAMYFLETGAAQAEVADEVRAVGTSVSLLESV